MKKLVSILCLAGLTFIGCSDKADPFEKIARSRRFNIQKYKEYRTNSIDFSADGRTYIGFDLNENGEIDLMATTDTPFSPYASRVGIDKNEDGIYEILYADNDGDGYLETER